MNYAHKIAVVTYDIVDDARRERLATLLSSYGPRVQLSVFEAQLTSPNDEADLREQIRDIVDVEVDQVRIYRMDVGTADQAIIIGAREIEERRDFYIIR